MKRILAFAAALALIAFTCCVIPVPNVRAQYMGTFAQQTVTKTFTGNMTATALHLDVQNLGQAAHSITVNANTACAVTLDGSSDGSVWYVLAADSSNLGQVAFSNGYFAHIRITVNWADNSACNGAPYTVLYTGYQFPIPAFQYPGNYQNAALSITTPQPVISAGTAKTFWEMPTFTCTNSGTSTAYLQVIDDLGSAMLGTGAVYQVGIPAGLTFQYVGPKIIGQSGLFLGASTTWGGSTAVGSAVFCSLQADQQVSFLSNQIFSP